MLGNDIVDFSIDERKYQNQRFIQRILSEKERHYLSQSKQKNAFLWTLWAAKEATYKACQKLNLNLLFSPKKFEITKESLITILKSDFKASFKAELKHDDNNLPIEIHYPNSSCVHCICLLEPDQQSKLFYKLTKLENEEDYPKQSELVRELAQSLLIELGIQAEIIRPEIQLDEYSKPGPPRLISNNQLLNHEISLSHDGRWLAVALLIKDS